MFEFGVRLGTTAVTEGIALELSAVRRVVAQLDGRVDFDDTETGEGIRVRVSLPAADRHATPYRAAPCRADTSANPEGRSCHDR